MEAAKENRRSATAEIIARLEESFSRDLDAELKGELKKQSSDEQEPRELHIQGDDGEVRTVTSDQITAAIMKAFLALDGGDPSQNRGPKPRKKYPKG